MSATLGHKHSGSVTQNQKAQLANAYNELGKELSSTKIRVVGNYNLGKVIGEGAYGKVRLGTHRLTSTRVAIKQIPKAMSSVLTREIHHHRQLHHPHVTQMYEVIATESTIWIVTELCSGGELFDYLAEKGRLGEEEAKIMFGQLCLAVAYLHEKGVVHRDLKLENVLMDERCRVKLGDFGFTREFERGTFMETFCGTTGYASPEMLESKKYLGPEVDVWSLGVILYCLLTGTLPFDDDDEAVMRSMIIKGDFEDPDWLSSDARDLIKNILLKDPAKRLSISQILAHPWFTGPPSFDRPNSSLSNLGLVSEQPSIMPSPLPATLPTIDNSPMSAGSDMTFLTATSQFTPSTPATAEGTLNDDPFYSINQGDGSDTQLNANDTSKKAAHKAALDSLQSNGGRASTGRPHQKHSRPVTPVEESQTTDDSTPVRARLSSNNSQYNPNSNAGSKGPPAYPVRTPARTKRRSVSSNLSDPASPTFGKSLTPLPPQDFASLLSTPAPIIFSTPLERELLNSLSLLGFDTGQIVHSVLSDACDAAGAIWWMLRRKAEKRAFEEGLPELDPDAPGPIEDNHTKRAVSVQTDSSSFPHSLSLARSAPELAFVPPTPTVPTNNRPATPPTITKSSTTPYLSPSGSSLADTSSRSGPSTPSGSLTDRQGSKGRRDGKVRSGSVSIMQRANTALEAVGIVRKKSSEAVKDANERDKEKVREVERKGSGNEEPRSSHGSGSSSSKLTKSPPLKGVPSTPSGSPDLNHPQHVVGSPWVVAGLRSSSPQSDTPACSPGDTLTSLPNFTENGGKAPASHRNRASLLTAFRLWFNEDRKGKRKEPVPPSPAVNARSPMYNRPHGKAGTPSGALDPGSVKRRTSGNAGTAASRKGGTRGKRASVSSRRSSSVNSRRSSGTSAQVGVLDSPHHVLEQIPTRQSFGSHTPNSERGDFPSRPSSLRSFSMPRHRKSPSASSASSTHFRTASPLQKYHRRGGSGSSTRVVRQIQPTQSAPARPSHVRSNSATSSIHSLVSSRPTSFYEPSESEGPRTGSPVKHRSRRSTDDTSRRTAYNSNSTFIAQKRQTPFTSPLFGNTIGRSSWKKSWGLEPPGWQSRSTHLPIEVLAVSPVIDGAAGIRDVFSGRHSLNLGDESDWVDEDDDVPAFAAGFGQTPTLAAPFSTFEQPLTLAPAPRGHGTRSTAKRASRSPGLGPGSGPGQGRQKPGHSPVGRTSPVQTDTVYESESRGGRRQLPTGRSGPAFRHAIQEEDEGEEE